MLQARGALTGWSRGAQAIALVSAAHEAGRLRYPTEPCDPPDLASFVGLGARRPEHLDRLVVDLGGGIGA